MLQNTIKCVFTTFGHISIFSFFDLSHLELAGKYKSVSVLLKQGSLVEYVTSTYPDTNHYTILSLSFFLTPSLPLTLTLIPTLTLTLTHNPYPNPDHDLHRTQFYRITKPLVNSE